MIRNEHDRALAGVAFTVDGTQLRHETEELRGVLSHLGTEFFRRIEQTAHLLRDAFDRGGKALICGNGGSAAEAQHFSDEMLGRYKSARRSYPVIALTADTAALTCIGNDFGFEEIFSRQIDGLGNPGDVLIAISTSGNSPNILRAAEAAKNHDLRVVALTGPNGRLRTLADISLESPSSSTARIQEVHLHIIHLLCECFEDSDDSSKRAAERFARNGGTE